MKNQNDRANPQNDAAEDPLFSGKMQPGVGRQHQALFARTEKPEPFGPNTVILDSTDPFDIAKEFIERKYFKYGSLSLYYKGGGFWQFNGSHYEEFEWDVLSAEVYAFIGAARCHIAKANIWVPIVVKPEDVEKVMKCIKAGTTIPVNLPQPSWIDTQQPAPELFGFKNKIVNVRTGEAFDPTPRLWITDAVNFDYDPDAKCPRWDQFLREIHPGDKEAQDCIEEQLGYGMTYDMQFDKIAVWFGKPRAGKTTLVHVQKELCGRRAFAPMSFDDWTRGEKSRENLIGKKVLAFSDVRLPPPKWWGKNLDPGGLDRTSVRLLLAISGRDLESVGQLYKKAWEGRLTCKIIITSNDPLNIQDQTLLTRLVMVHFQESWLYRDDIDPLLEKKLDGELPGIANKCLAAYRRLLERGYFVQPKTADHLAKKMAADANPIAAFMQKCWIKDDKERPGPFAAQVHFSFEIWCQEHGRSNLLESFPREQELMKAIKHFHEFSWLKRVRHDGETAGRYPGLRRRTKEDEEETEDEEAEIAEVEAEIAETSSPVVELKTWRRF
jgi:putative DNA primase/helicase